MLPFRCGDRRDFPVALHTSGVVAAPDLEDSELAH